WDASLLLSRFEEYVRPMYASCEARGAASFQGGRCLRDRPIGRGAADTPLFESSAFGDQADNLAQPTMCRLIAEPSRPIIAALAWRRSCSLFPRPVAFVVDWKID